MRHATVFLTACVAVGGCVSGSGAIGIVRAPVPDGSFVAGYHPYWAGDAWREYPLDIVDELFFFETEADGEGRLFDSHGWPGQWASMAAAARGAGARVTPTVSMHDPAAFESLFPDAERVERLVASQNIWCKIWRYRIFSRGHSAWRICENFGDD